MAAHHCRSSPVLACGRQRCSSPPGSADAAPAPPFSRRCNCAVACGYAAPARSTMALMAAAHALMPGVDVNAVAAAVADADADALAFTVFLLVALQIRQPWAGWRHGDVLATLCHIDGREPPPQQCIDISLQACVVTHTTLRARAR
jgi:hypothetical protein